MYVGRTTLSKFLLEQLRDEPDGELLAALVVDVAAGIRNVATLAARPRTADRRGKWLAAAGMDLRAGALEDPQPLEAAANEAILRHSESSGLVAGFASTLMDQPCAIEELHRRGPYLLRVAGLEGTHNLDVNAPLGTLFSALPHDAHTPPEPEDFLQPGSAQVAAGYAIYGPATLLVVSVGHGTHGFTLDREFGNFILTHPDLRVPADTSEFAIDTCHERFWEMPVARYVGECKAGRAGSRGRDFTMRWSGSAVAEVHRILTRGGVLLEPQLGRGSSSPSPLRLAFEAAPLAMLVEQADGLASTGRGRLLAAPSTALHEHVPVVLGSCTEIERIERYHHEHDCGVDRASRSPLFGERSLYLRESGFCGRAATCPQSTL